MLIDLQSSKKFTAQKFRKKITNGHDKELLKERYICPEVRQKIIEDLRLIINFLDNTPNRHSIHLRHMVTMFKFWCYFKGKNCLFGGTISIKNDDLVQYVYSCYCVGFVSRSEFSVRDCGVDRTYIVFKVDMSSSVRFDNNKKYVIILHKGPTKVLDDTMLTAQASIFN